MEYKGYHANVEFDTEDMLFIGEVFGINDSLNFHGSTVAELESMFHQSIENYLSMCKEFGKEPDKEFKGSFNVRVSPEIHRRAALEATRQNITLNQYVASAIEQSFDKATAETIIYVLPEMTNRKKWNFDITFLNEANAYKASPRGIIREEVLKFGC